jgi:post-segregation antitoxin (ccd killing protein)
MSRIQVYVNDDLHRQIKERELPASEIFQQAVEKEIARLRAIEAMDDYLNDLVTEVGRPTAEEVGMAADSLGLIKLRKLAA